MTFRVGQKVCCVDSGGWPHLNNGEVYTVLATTDQEGNPGFLTVNCQPGGGAYRRHRFRPIVERKTEVSFTTGADPSTDQFDNRRKVRVRV